MARKLKSDRMLFLATVLLVGLSILMVYSASAMVAQERYQQPYLFLTKQVMWAFLGMALPRHRDAHRLPDSTASPCSSGRASGVVTLALIAVLFSPPVNNARRWFGLGGLGIQPSELAKLVRDLLHRRAARAAHAPHQRRPLLADADRASSSAAWSR